MDEKKYGLHLNPVALGLSLGILWGVSTFIMALIVMNVEYGVAFVEGLGNLYIGYEATWLGALIGLIWGFLDAFVGGFLLAWLYNFFNCCCHKKCSKRE